MITIVDYGLGNVRAFLNVFKRLNILAKAAHDSSELVDATKLILPGVGHFDHAVRLLNASGMRETLDSLVLDRGVPVLGVCVGMQILGKCSDEGEEPGLGWISGEVLALQSLPGASACALPHMGWNDVAPVAANRLFDNMPGDPRFYFLHSYYFKCEQSQDVAAVSSYGGEFSAAVSARNIHGVQFHPEKSHQFGTRLLKNFAEM